MSVNGSRKKSMKFQSPNTSFGSNSKLKPVGCRRTSPVSSTRTLYLPMIASIVCLLSSHLLGRPLILLPVFQRVAHSWNGKEKAGFSWIQFHFLTEVADMGFDQTSFSFVVKAPDVCNDLL